ncbi:MAG: ABC transporter ATP-binding protein [Actinobacteria bacterium]|nr:MAG: ABC transporter ATP-binding protein [Actinomycetota bacterium]
MAAASSETDGAGDIVLDVTGLSWGVGGLVILEGIDLEVRAGEFISIIGPNGAGKTSLINVISGVHKPRSGTVELLGEDVTGLRPADRTRLGLGRTFQTSSLFPGLTVEENVRLAAQADLGGSLKLLTVPGPHDDAQLRTSDALEKVGLIDRKADLVGELSHGDKRKLELAVVLSADPAVLLLDEPTAGVSVEETRPLVDLIQSVHETGKAIVMVEHRMEFVVDVSQRIAVMHEGRLLTVGSPDDVMGDQRVREAYLGGVH